MNYSLYRLDTGELLPGDVIYTRRPAKGELPEGVGVLEGSHDHMCKRVDVATGTVVDWVPPRPLDDDNESWDWDDVAKLWQRVKKPKAIAQDVRAKRDALLATTDWVTLRALDRKADVPQEWKAYREALRDITQQPGFPIDVVWPTPPAA